MLREKFRAVRGILSDVEKTSHDLWAEHATSSDVAKLAGCVEAIAKVLIRVIDSLP